MLKANDKFGSQLQTARMAAGLSRRQLADAAGVGMSSIANWESAGGKTPYQSNVDRLNATLFPHEVVADKPAKSTTTTAKPSKATVKVSKPKVSIGTKSAPTKQSTSAQDLSLEDMMHEIDRRGFICTIHNKTK